MLGVASVLSSSAPASAQTGEAGAEDQAAARVLFTEGRRLMKAGQYDEACPKLEAASKLYPGSGVYLNLADCFERAGRIASAWSEFGEAATAAIQSRRAHDEVEAKRRQAELEPRLSRVIVGVAKEAPGLVVTRNGKVLGRGAWGTAIPVDPGKQVVTASAAGFVEWSVTVPVTEPGATVTVTVPELVPVAAGVAPVAPTPVVPGPAPAPASRATYWTTRRTVGVAVAGAGVVTAVIGGALGLAAKGQDNAAQSAGGAARHDDSVNAVTAGNVASVVFGVGAGIAAAGVVVWLTAPSAQTTVGTNGTTLLLRGTF